MAFNIIADIQLRGPSNLKNVAGNIQKQLSSVQANVNINVPRGANRSLTTLSKNLQTVEKRLEAAEQAAQRFRGTIGGIAPAIQGFATSTREIAASLRTVDKLSSASQRATKSNKELASSTNAVATSGKQIKGVFAGVTNEFEAFGRQSGLALKRFAAFTLAAGTFIKVRNSISDAVQESIDFQRQVVSLSQVTGRSVQQLVGLTGELRNLSTSLGVSSTSIVQVARTLAQAGLSIQDVQLAASALAKTELAPTFGNITKTTEGAVAIMAQFEVQARDLEKSLGAVNLVASQFAVESDDLITAVQKAGGTFKAAGGNLNELLALFTAVRSTTRESADTISTGFRTIFARLQRPKVIDFLRQFNIELEQSGKFVGPVEAIRRLNAELSKLESTDIRFSQIVEQVGGVRQFSKVVPLIQQFPKAIEALAVAQAGQTSLTKDAETAQQALSVQIQKTREEFLKLIDAVVNSRLFRTFTEGSLEFTQNLLKLGQTLSDTIPLLLTITGIKLTKGLFSFGKNLFTGAQTFVGLTQGKGGTTAPTPDVVRANQVLNKNTSEVSQNNRLLSTLTSAIRQTGRTGFASGGFVPGTGRGDKVPAMLEPGEFVLRRRAVENIGRENVSRMNKGGLVPVKKFQTGGDIIKSNILLRPLGLIGQIATRGSGTARVKEDGIQASKTSRGKKLIQQIVPNQDARTIGDSILLSAGVGSSVLSREKTDNIFNKQVRTPVLRTLQNSLRDVAIDRNRVPKLDKNTVSTLSGTIFELALSSLSGIAASGKQAPFDFLPSNTTERKNLNKLIKPQLPVAQYIDAKNTLVPARAIISRAVSQGLYDDRIKQEASRIGDVLQQTGNVDDASFNKSRIKSKRLSSKAVKEVLGKRFGGLIQKFATGGLVPSSSPINREEAAKILGNAHRRDILESEFADQVLSYIPRGSTFLGDGIDAVGLKTPQNTALRISRRFQHRPNIPEILQALRQAQVGNFFLEELPLADPFFDKRQREETVAGAARQRGRFDKVRQAFENRLLKRGIQATDAHDGNLATVRVGNATRVVSVDPQIGRARFRGDEEVRKLLGLQSGGLITSAQLNQFIQKRSKDTGIDFSKVITLASTFSLETAKRLGQAQTGSNRIGRGGFNRKTGELGVLDALSPADAIRVTQHELAHGLDLLVGQGQFASEIGGHVFNRAATSHKAFRRELVQKSVRNLSPEQQKRILSNRLTNKELFADAFERTANKRPVQPHTARIIRDEVAKLAREETGPGKPDISQFVTQKPRGFANGGFAFTPNPSKEVPALLEPGEFVFNKTAVNRIGSSKLERMNKFHSGGFVKMQGGGNVAPNQGPGSIEFLRISEDLDRFAAAAERAAIKTSQAIKAVSSVIEEDIFDSIVNIGGQPAQAGSKSATSSGIGQSTSSFASSFTPQRTLPSEESLLLQSDFKQVALGDINKGQSKKPTGFSFHGDESAIGELAAAEQEIADAGRKMAKVINDISNGLSNQGRRSSFIKRARGGIVPGSGRGDKVPALLEPGEFVLRRQAVENIGVSHLFSANRMAKGGFVGIKKYQTGSEVTSGFRLPNVPGQSDLDRLGDILDKINRQIDKTVAELVENNREVKASTIATREQTRLAETNARQARSILPNQPFVRQGDLVEQGRQQRVARIGELRQQISQRRNQGIVSRRNFLRTFGDAPPLVPTAVPNSRLESFRFNNLAPGQSITDRFRNKANGSTAPVGAFRQRLRGFGEDPFKLSLGLGTVAGLAGQFLPDLEQSARTGKNLGLATAGSGLQGAAGGAAIGAQLGSFAGPLGTVAGTAIGALTGFVTGLEEAKNRINQIKFDESLERFSRKLNEIAQGETLGNFDGNAIRQDLEALQKQFQIGTVEGGFNFGEKFQLFQANLKEFFGDSGAQQRAVGDILTERTKNRPIDKQFFSSLQKELPALTKFGTLLAKNSDSISDFEKSNNQAGRTIIETIAAIKQVPINQVKKEFEQQIEAAKTARNVQVNFADAQAAAIARVQEIASISSAIKDTELALRGFSNQLELSLSSFSGEISSGNLANLGAELEFGRVDTTAFIGALNKVTGPLGIAGQKLNEDIRSIDSTFRELPSIISESLITGTTDTKSLVDNIEEKLLSADIDGGKISSEITRRIVTSLAKLGDDEIKTRAQSDINKLVEDLIGEFKGLETVLQNAAKATDEQLGKFTQGLARNQQLIQQINEQRVKSEQLAIDAERTRLQVQLRRQGRDPERADDTLLQRGDLLANFSRQQQRLVGQNVNGLDPQAIAAALSRAQIDLQAAATRRDAAQGTPEFKKAAEEFAEINAQVANTTQALKNLTNPANLAAGIQERLNRIKQEEIAATNLFQQALGAGSQDLRKTFSVLVKAGQGS